jgi:hypothetical protein
MAIGTEILPGSREKNRPKTNAVDSHLLYKS